MACCFWLAKPSEPRCNIQKVSLLSPDDVIADYPTLPTIYVGDPRRNEKLAHLTMKETLLSSQPDTVNVKLTSSNRYSQGLKTMTLKEYIHYTTSTTTNSAANETFYLFGGNVGEPFATFNAEYVLPPCHAIGCDVAGGHSFGMAGRGTGVVFHLHGAVYAEQIWGKKRWFLFAPPSDAANPLFQEIREAEVNMSVAMWYTEVYPRYLHTPTTNSSCTLGDNGHHCKNSNIEQTLYECEVQAGEILYIPTGWKHATLNTGDYNVFMSLFLDFALIK